MPTFDVAPSTADPTGAYDIYSVRYTLHRPQRRDYRGTEQVVLMADTVQFYINIPVTGDLDVDRRAALAEARRLRDGRPVSGYRWTDVTVWVRHVSAPEPIDG